MANLINQKILRLAGKSKPKTHPEFITEDVVEIRRAKMVYYKWISRLTIVLATISLCFGVCLTLSILKIAPAVMIDLQIFIPLSDSQSAVQRELINHKMVSREKIMINFMKQYVEYRNAFIKDEQEMLNRWIWGGIVSYLSTYPVYKEFAKQYPRVAHEMGENKGSRSVEIKSVERIGGENSYTWQVKFTTYDYTYKGDTSIRRSSVEPLIIPHCWTANISAKIDPRRRTAYRRLLNPLGFVVTRYFQSPSDCNI